MKLYFSKNINIIGLFLTLTIGLFPDFFRHMGDILANQAKDNWLLIFLLITTNLILISLIRIHNLFWQLKKDINSYIV